MIIRDEEFEYLHINTLGKEKDLTEEELEQIKDAVRDAKESRKRVMESKITDRTIM